MPEISRRVYYKALVEIMTTAHFDVSDVSSGYLIASKNGRRFYVDLVGKNLPYFGKNGAEAFPWETYIPPRKMESIELNAKIHNAEAWLAYCYAIFGANFEPFFQITAKINGILFGVKMISTQQFKQNMRPRSNSWSKVDLPRDSVATLTNDPNDV